jgi:carbonic anhydrase/acetyltransferase-like protein (isoleucine patch superfamily)
MTAPLSRVASDVKLGRGVVIHGFVNLYGCEIGAETRLGCFVEVQKGVRIGARCVVYGVDAARAPVRLPDHTCLWQAPLEGGGAQLTIEATIELEGSSKPACVAESVSRRFI